MRIDDNTVAQARAADVLAFFEKYSGFTFAHRGGEYRCRQHPSLAVKHDRLSWFWHSKGIGGYGVLDYLVKVENMPFRQAVETITGVAPATAAQRQEPPKLKTLTLPEKAGLTIRLFDYLCNKRGIDNAIVNRLIQEKKLYEDRRGNVVFVGHDGQGKPRFASLRGTYGAWSDASRPARPSNPDCRFRRDCAGSDKRFGFNMVACVLSERLYVFESPIDAMSHASLVNAVTGDTGAWKRHSRLSLAGTTGTAVPFFLNQYNAINELIFCLDNDQAGRKAAAQMAGEYTGKGYSVWLEIPEGKDFNEDLTVFLTDKANLKRRYTPERMI